jgi:hypothetical protein
VARSTSSASGAASRSAPVTTAIRRPSEVVTAASIQVELSGSRRPRCASKRVYGEEAVERIALIDLLKQAGFTLSEIAALAGPDGRNASRKALRHTLEIAELSRAARFVTRSGR